ncbi:MULTISPECIES: PEP-CTERM sorting domain-containing protein [unclassified Coleofasciculus]|uniref:PEP-CTERM sorting domain-containing protein n=1 Tax=unclassified Coleofasciculus TaxID=2692782 RepID=UPI00187E415D|nr:MULTISPECIES: PEP-CTERM sorting domain-containing protein [unclassified Coleofasciculus]MBE9128569.1 PEP-CTERM sorting domain-containing protein [Coleofasciculus sp. LEGE 07081]MBE9147936.1 PEP-CTERM sorting domain-containing protein [Coleofasciculus sp. LEGE 07092]
MNTVKTILKLSLTSTLATLIALLTSPAAKAIIIDFEDVPDTFGWDNFGSGSIEDEVSDFESNQFFFKAADETDKDGRRTGFTVANDSHEAYNGSTYIVLEDFIQNDGSVVFNPMTISQKNGNSFSLHSLDIAEWEEEANQARDVEIRGCLFGKDCNEEGGFVSVLIRLDGNTDGAGPVNDFQGVTFDKNWGNLSSVLFKGINAIGYDDGFPGMNSFAIDNIEVKEAFEPEPISVPEPTGALGFLTLGAFCVGSGLKRKLTQR